MALRVPKPNAMRCTKNPRSTPRRSTPRRSRPRRSRTHDARPKKTVKYSLASNQRAVFDWYEKKQYRDDAGVIFSPEWQCRLTDWRIEFDPDMQKVHDRLVQLEQDPENLKLGLFFVAHSVAAFSLWHLLQACYELDKRICGTSKQQNKELAEWQHWPPFQYLLSTHIVSTWEANLVSFSSQVKQSANIFQKENVASRLFAMVEGIQVLEEALSILTSVFEGKRKDMHCCYWMLRLIREGVDNRYRAIEKHITHH